MTIRLNSLIFFITLCAWASQTIAASSSGTQNPHAARKVDLLFDLVGYRLDLMKDVAATKWQNKIAIEDLDRESIVIEKAAADALTYGLTPASSRFFFAMQIEAAKEIQRYWFDEWAGNRKFEPPQADLQKDIRPKLLTMGTSIVEAISDSYPLTDRSLANRFVRSVHVEGLSDATKHALFRALFEIDKFETHLDQIVATGQLRVGTTGDYSPFSYLKEDAYEGIDIELAQDLAASLGVELSLIKTSWPTLMEDLANGAFDIGMSGISKNLQRQKSALFSNPYHSGGKTPIVRCENTAKFSKLELIDLATTRLIVNPGGTNEKFVRKNIKNANILVHENNRTIFDEIIAGRADIMITDAIEVTVQAQSHPELCAAMPGETLSFQEKAFLLPRDMIWQQYVNGWLSQRKGEGRMKKIFAKHLEK
ncbi:MAG: cyclohexadienyl dehydratase [Candidatus Azotimanducaceae bacterium]|jgi:cyclohexadienyl dehydratase